MEQSDFRDWYERYAAVVAYITVRVPPLTFSSMLVMALTGIARYASDEGTLSVASR